MKRFAFCVVLLTASPPVSADQETQDTAVQPRSMTVNIVPSVQLSPTVKESIERSDTDLRTAAMQGLNSTDKGGVQRVVYFLKTGNQAAGQREWQTMLQQATTRPGGVPGWRNW